jgi:16S rRNA pseudouridine516 synthase
MSVGKSVRLDRLLANLGYGSRREIQILARTGRIRLDGAVLRDVEQRVVADQDFAARLTVDGEPLDPLPGLVSMMNKPLGVTCSHKEGGPLVYRLLPDRWRLRDPPLSTIGRLDKDTSGLLLLTDDGGLLHKVISPRRQIAKTYRATLDRPLRGDEADIFASGALMLEGEDKPLLPARLAPLGPTEALLTIVEGRYHQVRRMFAAVGNHVVALHRVSVGGLALPEDLAPGEFTVLDAEGVARIFAEP